MEIIDLDAVRSYIKTMKVIYPAVEWRITLNGKVQEVDEEGETENNTARHDNGSLSMLIASVVCLYFYRIL